MSRWTWTFLSRALVGSESTLVTILEATLHLVPSPKARTVTMLGFTDLYLAAECAVEVLKFNPIACEGFMVAALSPRDAHRSLARPSYLDQRT
jgi:FAD/FMN-containing dehydrogenase